VARRTLEGLAGFLRMKAMQNSALFLPHKKHDKFCQHKPAKYVE